MIMTKHKEASAEALGTRICLNLDSPSSQTAPMVMHQPREELNVLVNRIYEYIIKLASDNAVELTDDELRSSDNTILNLQNYLKAQKRIFEAAA